MAGPSRGERVNKQRFCAIMGWTRQIFDKHVREGMPLVSRPDDKGGEYLIDTAEAIRWLINRASGGSGEEIDFNVERARLTKEQADKTAMENQRLRRELLPADEVTYAVTSAFAAVKSRIRAIPPKLAPRLLSKANAAEIEATLAAVIDEALQELAETRVVTDLEGA